MPIRKGDGTAVIPSGFQAVRKGDGTIIWEAGPDTLDQAEAHYEYEDTADTTTAVDSVGSNDGTINGATYVAESAVGDNSLSFDGNDYVDLPFTHIPAVASFSTWYKTTSTAREGLYSQQMSGEQPARWATINYQPGIGGATTGSLAARFMQGSGDLAGYSDVGGELYDGNWHHIAIIVHGDTGDIDMYFDGSEIPVTMSAVDTKIDETGDRADLGVGTAGTSGRDYWFTGEMDDTAWYPDYKLSAEEVSDLYARGSGGTGNNTDSFETEQTATSDGSTLNSDSY